MPSEPFGRREPSGSGVSQMLIRGKDFLRPISAMRFLLFLFLVPAAAAQSMPRIQFSHTPENLRGASAVSRQIAWASGAHGTYLRTTDGGRTWAPAEVPDASTLDFRAVVAFSASEAFLMSAGPGDQSRIYHTTDAGQHWQLEFTNANPKGFFDSMAFWNPTHGIVLGDPVPDENGKLHFELLETDDGQTWHQIPPAQLPQAVEGEGAFAASNTCIAILRSPGSVTESFSANPVPNQSSAGASERARTSSIPPEQTWRSSAAAPPTPTTGAAASAPDANLWFATGGKAARVFHSPDGGKTWEVFDTPILHGRDSTGIFSIAFRDALHGVIAGGDYKRPKDDGPNLAFTEDGGKTWTLSDISPQAYFSAVAYDARFNQEAKQQAAAQQAAEKTGKKIWVKPTAPQRLFVVGEDFVFDFRPPHDPRRLSGSRRQPVAFNAVSPYPEGGAFIVGPKGVIVFFP
jgi:photosystem II stability/assembly factor-like uncharacterized protein